MERRTGPAEQARPPHIGALEIAKVKPRHIRDMVLELRKTDLAIHVYSTCHAMFRYAVIDELALVNPCVLAPGVLPKKVDADPSWRAGAIFTRAELVALATDARLLPDRCILHALKGLAGLRNGEACGLRWQDYDPSAKPLGKLDVARSYGKPTKTQVPRQVPVHPLLASLLTGWRLRGWRELYGRKPQPTDLIVPTRKLTMRKASQCSKDMTADLDLLELRHRRGHDLRRTFVSL